MPFRSALASPGRRREEGVRVALGTFFFSAMLVSDSTTFTFLLGLQQSCGGSVWRTLWDAHVVLSQRKGYVFD